MTNDCTNGFRKMMLNGRMIELMTDAVEEGIAATTVARSAQGRDCTIITDATENEATREKTAQLRRIMRPIYFTPGGKAPRQLTEAERRGIPNSRLHGGGPAEEERLAL